MAEEGKWSFGGMTSVTQRKTLSEDFELTNWKIIDNYKPNLPYYVFLVDKKPNEASLGVLTSRIERNGIASYSIFYCLKINVYVELTGSVTEFMVVNKSSWKEFILENNRKVEGLVTLGQSLYQITESADLLIEHFSNSFTMCSSYIYWPSEFEGLDCRVYPCYDVAATCYVPQKGDKAFGTVTWQTRFFEYQMRIMVNRKFLPMSMDSYEIIVAHNEESTRKILTTLMNSEKLAIDTETDGFDVFSGDRIFCITLSNDEKIGYHIDWELVSGNSIIYQQLVDVLMSAKKTIFANAQFDIIHFWALIPELEYKFYPTDSVDRLAHVICSSRPKGLKPLTYLYTCLGGYEKELERYKKQVKIKSYKDIPKPILHKYAALDAICTLRLFNQLMNHITYLDKKFPNEKDARWTMYSFYEDIIMGTYNQFIDMKYRGVYVDKEKLQQAQTDLMKRQENLIKKLREIWELDEEVNIQSGEALGKIFVDKGWEEVERTKKGFYTTNEDSLNVWERANRPGIKELKELRGVSQCLKTFIGQTDFETDEGTSGWMKMIRYHPEDNSYRLHPSVNVGGAETFRNQMRQPNLQNITMRGEFADVIKPCLTVPDVKKYKMMTIDASGLQSRLAGVDSKLNPSGMDKMMWDLYKPGGLDDQHSATAFQIYCKSLGANILEIEDETGKKYMFGDRQKIKIKRNNEFVIILAKELESTDVIDEEELYNFKKDFL